MILDDSLILLIIVATHKSQQQLIYMVDYAVQSQPVLITIYNYCTGSYYLLY